MDHWPLEDRVGAKAFRNANAAILKGFPMKVLLVGASGHVGTFTTPYIIARHQVRVLDLGPPSNDDVEYVQGSNRGLQSLLTCRTWPFGKSIRRNADSQPRSQRGTATGGLLRSPRGQQ